MNTLPPPPEMERAYRARDASYDGIFFLGVRTTGIFCRPSCPARSPRPENVEFFGTVAAALFAGYRPCLRCHPLEADGRPPEWVAGLLETIDGSPAKRLTDSDLRTAGVVPARARRNFRPHYGMTFQAYCRARRMGGALEQLRRGCDLDDVALDNGYDSHSGFRDAFVRTFGRPPGQGRAGDALLVTWMESPVGPLVAGANSEGVCLLEFSDRRMLDSQFATLRKRFACSIVPGENAHLQQLRSELAAYFVRTLRRFTVPLVYPGTPFQQRVWSELLRIPYGETRSYEALADACGCPGAQRAVGRANGTNRIAIVIPCHRVVNKDGQLGGYGGGLWRKQILLDLERSALERQNTVMALDCEIRTVSPQPTMSIRGHTSPTQIAATIGEYLTEVWGYVTGNGGQPVGPPFTRYHVIDGDRIELEGGIPVAGPLPAQGRVHPGSLPGGEAAVTTHVGHYEELPVTGQALADWVAARGREAAGPNWEVYVTDPGSEPDPRKWRTDIYKPLQSA